MKYQFIMEFPPPGVRVRKIIKVAAAIKGPNGISPFTFILNRDIPIIENNADIINDRKRATTLNFKPSIPPIIKILIARADY